MREAPFSITRKQKMAKIKLGARPKSFKRVVKVPMLDGTEGTVEVVYKYRTRSEFGRFIDEITEAAGVKSKPATDDDGKFSFADLMDRTKESNAEYILKVAEGWNLDEEFTLENVSVLCDELPGAAAAIMENYRLAVTEGRLGN